jgi:signal transduction histidine kinase
VTQAGLDRSVLDGVLEELRFTGVKAKEAASERAPAATARPRVLVVEDNPDMNRVVAECLSRDYDVVTAFDGRDGIEQALRVAPMVIVSDIMMPHVSGVEMVAQMRARPELQHTPILLLSAKADEELMVELLDHGAQDFIIKPFSERDLRVRVHNLVLGAQARAAAESANRAKDEFLAMLGHELRNPLSPIVTALQLMKLRGESGSERERTVIERQVNHLTRLVDDLLDVSRIARGRVELKSEIVEVAEVVAKAVEMPSPLLERRNHTLKIDVPRRGLRVDGDTTRLAQVISNLLTNAAKYTPPNGAVTVRAEQVNDEVVLSVRDTGIGISPEVLPRIFDLFVQERQALDRSQGGLGIGLTIVRSLVERHGGSVLAHSDGPGQGSEFIIRLPLKGRADSAARAVVPAAAAAPGGGAVRILVVDDNEDSAEMLADALIGKGYDTRVAHDAPAALRLAAEFSPHVAFLDLGLPVMDGYELASHLRGLPGLAGLRLIAVTGHGQESDLRRTEMPASMAISSSRWISTRSKPHSSRRRSDPPRNSRPNEEPR